MIKADLLWKVQSVRTVGCGYVVGWRILESGKLEKTSSLKEGSQVWNGYLPKDVFCRHVKAAYRRVYSKRRKSDQVQLTLGL